MSNNPQNQPQSDIKETLLSFAKRLREIDKMRLKREISPEKESTQRALAHMKATQALTVLMTEWRPAVGYEGIYEVSNFGEIRYTVGGSPKQTDNGAGYIVVRLTKDKVSKMTFVHRVVATAFIPNHDNKPQVNHKDGDKTNNNVRNLEWSTAMENSRHAHANGFGNSPKGEINGSSKLTAEDVADIKLFANKGIMQKDIARAYPVARQTIQAIVTGKRWRHI